MLYAVESCEFSCIAITQLQAACMCALSKIFHIKGSNLEYVDQHYPTWGWNRN